MYKNHILVCGPQSGTGTRRQRNTKANSPQPNSQHSYSAPPPPSQKPRPRPTPVHKGTPAYEQIQASRSQLPHDMDIAAAEQLVAFQHQGIVPRTVQHKHTSKLTTSQPHLTLDEQVFAGAMGISKAEMLKQREYERQYGFEDSLSDPEEEETSARLSTQQKQQSRRMKNSRPVFNDDEDNDSETSDGGDEVQKAWNNLVGSVEKFNIVFEVPYKTSQRNLTGITSHTTFVVFIDELAKRMETRLSLLSNISYLPSYKPKTRTTDVMLEGEEDWIILIRDAWDHVRNTRGKKTKAWTIRIFDKSPTETTGKGKEKDGGIKNGKRSIVAAPSDQLPASDSDADILVAIQGKNHCNACQAACYVLANGDHYRFDDEDMNTWVQLASRHQATVNDPPSCILTRLGEKLGHQKRRSALPLPPPSVPSVPPQTPIAPAPATDAITQAMTMVGTVTPLLAMLMNGNRTRDHSPPRTSSSKRHRADSSPAPASSPSKASPSKNEELLVWLPKVDADVERGKRNADYTRYGDILAKKGIFDLDDLVRLTSERLEAFTGMAYGFCDRLLRYAREDLGIKLSKQARIG
ncbi:uncharacterized protein C8R40DRAFT_446677 [Lentinula edodes]|uniref:uncharacterized protein n=1 Tax=Lentinula edodes TaxID=5353 RepID=UPI001E8D4B9B|nr:uncharacterized protein C8R40DRAFT_446677 [Lentinula edodes]KAH7879820.1 hypothetical protein C8R40DRAFT_446677 [Lentinula edodes]